MINWKQFLSEVFKPVADRLKISLSLFKKQLLSDYPIDLNTFCILYTNILEKYNIELTDQCIKDSNCFTICPKDDGDLFSNINPHRAYVQPPVFYYKKIITAK